VCGVVRRSLQPRSGVWRLRPHLEPLPPPQRLGSVRRSLAGARAGYVYNSFAMVGQPLPNTFTVRNTRTQEGNALYVFVWVHV
jgi:hypothetical protein